jgi:hypothetical protein
MYVQPTQCAVQRGGYKSKTSLTGVGVAPTLLSGGDLINCKKWKIGCAALMRIAVRAAQRSLLLQVHLMWCSSMAHDSRLNG